MKWKVRNKPRKDPHRWRLWFAWYPVKVGGEMIWFQLLAYRWIESLDIGGFGWLHVYEYKTNYKDYIP